MKHLVLAALVCLSYAGTAAADPRTAEKVITPSLRFGVGYGICGTRGTTCGVGGAALGFGVRVGLGKRFAVGSEFELVMGGADEYFRVASGMYGAGHIRWQPLRVGLGAGAMSTRDEQQASGFVPAGFVIVEFRPKRTGVYMAIAFGGRRVGDELFVIHTTSLGVTMGVW